MGFNWLKIGSSTGPL